jgi:hypothetical protein
VPVAHAEEINGRVLVHRPQPQGRGVRLAVAWLFHVLSARRIRLDAIGSFVWRQLDGQQTVAEIAQKLRAEFGDKVEPAEGRLGHMVRVLRREGLIAYPGWDDVVRHPDPHRPIR